MDHDQPQSNATISPYDTMLSDTNLSQSAGQDGTNSVTASSVTLAPLRVPPSSNEESSAEESDQAGRVSHSADSSASASSCDADDDLSSPEVYYQRERSSRRLHSAQYAGRCNTWTHSSDVRSRAATASSILNDHHNNSKHGTDVESRNGTAVAAAAYRGRAKTDSQLDLESGGLPQLTESSGCNWNLENRGGKQVRDRHPSASVSAVFKNSNRLSALMRWKKTSAKPSQTSESKASPILPNMRNVTQTRDHVTITVEPDIRAHAVSPPPHQVLTPFGRLPARIRCPEDNFRPNCSANPPRKQYAGGKHKGSHRVTSGRKPTSANSSVSSRRPTSHDKTKQGAILGPFTADEASDAERRYFSMKQDCNTESEEPHSISVPKSALKSATTLGDGYRPRNLKLNTFQASGKGAQTFGYAFPTSKTKSKTMTYGDRHRRRTRHVHRARTFDRAVKAGRRVHQRVLRSISEMSMGGRRAMEAIASLTEQNKERSAAEAFLRVLTFGIILTIGFVLFRTLGCEGLGFYCTEKSFPLLWKDGIGMLMIGGLIYSTGPTLTRPLLLPSLYCFFAAMFGFACTGQVPWLQNSLAGSSWTKPPSIYVYAAAFLALLAAVVYAFIIAPSKSERRLVGMTLVGILGFYTAAYCIATFAVAGTIYHLHHYQIAFHTTLFLRNKNDAPTTLVRWALMGVFVDGIAAYGMDSMIM